MKILENMNGCTGCNACFNACPKSAIEMVSNDEGFWYPEIDENKCIDCGLCKKVCPINNAKYDNFAEPECYAVMGDDELRKNLRQVVRFLILPRIYSNKTELFAELHLLKIGRLGI